MPNVRVCVRSLDEEESSQERGVLHKWRGYSYSVTPEKVLLSRPVLQAALGAKHGVLLLEGKNTHTTQFYLYVNVKRLGCLNKAYTIVSLTNGVFISLWSGGQVYSFGELPWKQNPSCMKTTDPILEAGLSEKHVVSVAVGTFHNGAVTEDGAVHMWGDNGYGQCGLSGLSVVPNPTPVGVVASETTPPRPVRIVELACGEQHTLALSVGHEVWSWGSGCQLGLHASSFPVWKPQKVEHLAGRHVLQVACGASHSLALVRCPPPLPPQEPRRPSEDKCGQCNQSVYTMTDKEDHVIISDNHYCPLGMELEEDNNRSASEHSLVHGTPSSRGKMKSSPSEPVLTTYTHSPKSATPSMSSPVQGPSPVPGPRDQVQSAGEVLVQSDSKDLKESQDLLTNGEVFEAATEPSTHETANSTTVQGLTGTGTKSSQYPDEQALKDYLKRLSDQTLAEQAAKSLNTAPCAQVSDFQCSFMSNIETSAV